MLGKLTARGTFETTRIENGLIAILFRNKKRCGFDGLSPFYKKCTLNLLHENAKLVVDFINYEVQYKNIKYQVRSSIRFKIWLPLEIWGLMEEGLIFKQATFP
jgi:hypothetical protein